MPFPRDGWNAMRKSCIAAMAGLLAGAMCAAGAAAPVEFSVGEFSFTRPEGWTWVTPDSPMRRAELAAPAVEGDPEDAEVTFFHFGPGQGGSVEANIGRWLSQFEEPLDELGAETAETEIHGTRVTFLSAAGTFLSGMPGGPTTPREGFAVRGAILESPQGDVYVKMTGPQATVEAAAAAFDAMVGGAAEGAH